MANAEHFEIVNQGVNAWNQWREESGEAHPDLSEANLSEANLSEANLSEANLSGADLSGANLSGANLTRANLSMTDLSEAILREAILSGADLRGADLSGANLTRANLSGANLRGADLNGAILSMTDLSEAILREAILREAILSGAVLRGADLSGADLSWANLNGANLSMADLSHSKCAYTIFGRVNLGQAIGLHTVDNAGPSTIGLDTFFNSEGKIPEAFLRGAGVHDIFIQYAASLSEAPFHFYSCFISYSHADKAFARRVHDSLQGHGVRCWLDEKQLLPGDHIHREIEEGIRLWDKVLLCCSEESLTSWWVDKEISKALKKEEQLWKERGKQVLAIIPLNLDGFMFKADWQDWKKQHLTDRLAADFTCLEKDNSKFEEQLEMVVKALRADLGAREPPPKPKL